MARSMFMWLRAATIVALATQTVAQTCYYPNGSNAPSSEKPCSSEEGSACCPDTWQCLDNGLCYNPAAKIHARYSCTDKDWNSPGCASNLCTYGKTLNGAEAITQCSNHNNDWCCNANRVDVDCCRESPSPRPFFKLQDGKAYATIGVNQASSNPILSTITGLASGTGGGSSPSRTPQPSSSRVPSSANVDRASSSASATPVPVTSISRSVSSGSAGGVTYEVTVLVTPTAAAGGNSGTNTSSSGGGSSNLGLIIGCAVGIPLALALLGILIWLLRKRRNQKKMGVYKDTPETKGSPTPFAGGAGAKLGKDVYRRSRPGTTEIDGAPVGPTQPISNLPGRAELDSGAGFQSGHGPAYAPDTVGIGGGNGDGRGTWTSAPPGYSPGTNQAAFAHPPNAMELADTSVLPVVREKDHQYQAYRPPPSELPTVKTPPEDVEKQLRN